MAGLSILEPARKLRIAIVGSGISGLVLAAAISLHPQINVTLYESAPSLREEGEAIGLYRNAKECLSRLSPDLRAALDIAGATEVKPAVRFMMGTGDHYGEKICDVDVDGGKLVVNRTRFLKEVMDLVPGNVMKFGKQVNSVDESKERIVLRFKDGEVDEVDCLVGCDGLNSIVRRHVLGDHAEGLTNPVFSGGYNFRTVVPLEDAVDAFGQEYCSECVQHGWIGADGGFCLTDFVDDGKAMQVVAGWAKSEPWPYEGPYVQWDKSRLRRDLSSWGSFGSGLTKLLTAQPELFAAAGRSHPDTPTYTQGRVCLVGDAAQSMSPFLGAGACVALEDVLALHNLPVDVATGRMDVVKALEIYTAKRQGRRSLVARISSEEAILLTGRAPGVGLDISMLRQAILDDKWREVSVLKSV